MFNPSYVQRSRHGIFYFRWTLPKRAQTGQPGFCIKISLRTREPQQALRLAAPLRYLAQRLIERGAHRLMNHQQLRELVHAHFAKLVSNAKARIDNEGPLSETMRAQLLDGIKSASFDLAHDFPLPVFAEVPANAFLDQEGIREGRDTIDVEKLARLLLSGRKAYFEEALRYSSAAEAFEFGQPEPRPEAQGKTQEPSLPLEQLVAEFWKIAKLENRWTPKTEGEKLEHIELLYERMGKEITAQDFGRKQAHIMRDTLLAYPPNRNISPLTRGKPLLEVLGMPDVAKLHPRTINKYLQTYSGLFNWAVRNGHCDTNPFEGLSVRTNQANRVAPRVSFDDGQLQTIMQALLAKVALKEEHHRWGSLIAIHSGARLNEIAQLHLEDIRQVDDIWCFDINQKDGTTKRLKNAASKRIVPIHPHLLDHNFMDYFERMKAKPGNDRLFPQLSYSKSDGYGRNLGRWVNESLLPDLNIKTDQLTFHSFRHTMVRKLIAADVSQAHIMAIVGHEPGTTTLSTYNRNGFPPNLLIAALTKAI